MLANTTSSLAHLCSGRVSKQRSNPLYRSKPHRPHYRVSLRSSSKAPTPPTPRACLRRVVRRGSATVRLRPTGAHCAHIPAVIVIAVPAPGVVLGAAWGFAAAAFAAASPPLPNARQLDFMEMETAQFMHFNVDTAWTPPPGFLNGTNPTCERLFVSPVPSQQEGPRSPT